MVWSKVERNGNGRRDGDTDEATGDGGDGVGQEKGREREGHWPSARYFHSADVCESRLCDRLDSNKPTHSQVFLWLTFEYNPVAVHRE